MKKYFNILIVLNLFFITAFTYSQDTTYITPKYREQKLAYGLQEKISIDKPTVAFALSGGGARGLSQIGVLHAFEENGIYPDLIVGTSMGSIIGGLFSSGYSVDEIDSIAVNTNWDDLLTINRQSNRRELFIDQKVTEDKAVVALRLDGLSLILPTSFNDGQKLSNYLNIVTFNAPLHSNDDFNLLKYKFRAVCTDLINGNPVILKSGTLSKALRASSSVTFFLPPVIMDSLYLVDGGLVENIPVQTAINEGADYVIAVNTTSPLHKEGNLFVPWIIADQIVSIPMKRLNNEQIELANAVITPDLNNLTSTDFKNIKSKIKAGYSAGLAEVEIIKGDIDSIYESNIKRDDYVLYEPYFAGELNLDEKIFFDEILSQKTVHRSDVLRGLYKLDESGKYKNISVKVISTETNTGLILLKEENPIIKKLNLLGSSAISSDLSGNIFGTLIGQPYNGRTVLNELIKLLKLYRNIGLSLANISELSFDEETGTLGIFVDEGVISLITTEGNYHTAANVITREFTIDDGDYFNIDRISEGLRNLRNTNLFDDAEVVLKKENGHNVVAIKVVERSPSVLRLGLKADNENRAQISVDIRNENLFGGGTELGLLMHLSSRSRGAMLEHKSNRIFETYFTYKINAFYSFNDVTIYQDDIPISQNKFSRSKTGDYRQIFYGLSLGVGTQVERFGNLIFQGKYQVNKIKNIQESPANPYDNKIVSLKISSTVDTQDKYPYPEKGIYFHGFYETAQSILGGEIGFTNISLEYKGFVSIIKDHVISPKIAIGFGDKTLPLSQQYSLGGLESFYGMREYEYRGRQILLTSLMYRYKLPFKMFFDTYIKARYDLGSIWDVQEQIRFKDLRHGVGAAVSFDTPIGPADFAVGRSFVFKKNLPDNPISWGDVQFYFSIGYYY